MRIDPPVVPTEPKGFSVVIDAHGTAWQRAATSVWLPAGKTASGHAFRLWVDLVMHEGPLTLVWEAS